MACVVGDGSSLMSAVYQLAASERLFYMTVDKIEQLLIQPLLQLGIQLVSKPPKMAGAVQYKTLDKT